MIKFTFYLFALILVAAATGVITVRNPVHAVLFLVLAFFSSAAIWLLLHAEFLAIALIIVYVGAVMVLFLFVVMMLDIHFVRLKEGFIRYFPWAAAVGAIILLEMILVINTFSISQPSSQATLPNTHFIRTSFIY
jgi:NADH-quinone oxidoreductase subunit J